MNYGGTGNQAVNTTYASDFKSDYGNKLLHNIFDDGIINNYLDVTISDVNGLVSIDDTYLTITWDNSSTGDIPVDYCSYVNITLYKNREAFYYVGQKVSNTGTYKFTIPTETDITGVYKLHIEGYENSTYIKEISNWWISPSVDEYIKLRPILSLLIKPNNRYSTDTVIYNQYISFTDQRKGEINHQLIKSDTEENIIIKLPSSLTGSGIAYVVAEFNWLENENNSVIYSISDTSAVWNQLNICSINYNNGKIISILSDSDGYYSSQSNSSIQSEGYINIDKLSGRDAGNSENDIPINNGVLNVGLDVEKVDGYNINDIAFKDGIMSSNLNANYLSDETDFYLVGNESNRIPRSNTILNIDLNVEMINGKTVNDLVVDSHVHNYNTENVTDGLIYKKLNGVSSELATHDSFLDNSFTSDKLDINSIIVNSSPLIITGSFEGTETYGNDQFTISFESNTFSDPPLVSLQPTYKNGTDYVKTIDKGYYKFTDYTAYETEKYAGKSVKIFITDTGSVSFIKDVIDESGNNWEVYLTVDGPANGSTTTSEMVVYYINTYSELITATWNNTNTTLDVGMFQCVENLPTSHLGSSLYQATYIQAYPSNITQSGFVLNYKIFKESLINNYLKKQTGTEEIYIHWIAIGNKL